MSTNETDRGIDPFLQEILDNEGLRSIHKKGELIDFLQNEYLRIHGRDGDPDHPGIDVINFIKPEWGEYDISTQTRMAEARKCMVEQTILGTIYQLEERGKDKVKDLEKENQDFLDLLNEIEHKDNPDVKKYGFRKRQYSDSYVPDDYNDDLPYIIRRTHIPAISIEKDMDSIKIYKAEPVLEIRDNLFWDTDRYKAVEIDADAERKNRQEKIDKLNEQIEKIKNDQSVDPKRELEKSFNLPNECIGSIELSQDQQFRIPSNLMENFLKEKNGPAIA